MDTIPEKQQYHDAELGSSGSLLPNDEASALLSPRLPPSSNTKPTKSPLQYLYTLYMFTRSDFKTVIIPQSIFALCAASRTESSPAARNMPSFIIRVAFMLLWLWLHLIVENVANQRLEASVLEDAANKPWRPIPSGLISPRQSQAILRYAVPLCLLASSSVGGMPLLLPSATLMVFVWLYNDLDGSAAGPLQRSAINAAGLACFGWGALAVLLSGEGLFSAAGAATINEHGGGEILPRTLQLWIALTALVVFSTVHAADFPDVEGDRERGRQTMPLVYGEAASRWVLAVAVPGWSVASLLFWDVAVGVYWVAPLLVAGCMASLTVLRRDDHGSDEGVWKLWCLWTVTLFVLPLAGST
ncbi:UbiA prenyltransferase family-domain-containing protein [Microdochium bolleyi]|uniref:UbiA prenyltransferase family-domain-containing protein n=1 Tax=Microdochium bolleyi TaxID=196109 RepID=A0A136JCB1_9PEZI|nr:UbiA prenyltransferase family-domain-containing protein [Microdochium bolleyi]